MDRRTLLKSSLLIASVPVIANVSNYPSIPSTIEAAGVGGVVHFPEGIHYQYEPWHFLPHQIISGTGIAKGAGGELCTVIKSTLTSGIAITLPLNNYVRDIEFKGTREYNATTRTNTGSSTADCMDITGSPTFDNVRFRLWRNVGIIRDSCFYGQVRGGEIDRCDNVFIATKPVYNFEFAGAKITNCNGVINATNGALWSSLKFLGGSVESYASAFNAIKDASFTSTYFETFREDKRVFTFNSSGNSASDMHINLTNCPIYMNHTDRFINLSGIPNASLRSVGNKIITSTTIAGDTATAGPTSHTYLYVGANHTGKVSMDDVVEFRGVADTELRYINNQSSIAKQNIFLP